MGSRLINLCEQYVPLFTNEKSILFGIVCILLLIRCACVLEGLVVT